MRAIILRPMLRNKLIVFALVIQIALSFSISANSIQIILDMYRRVSVESGIKDESIVIARLQEQGEPFSADDFVALERAWKSLGKDVRVSFINTIPIASPEWTIGVKADATQTREIVAAQYVVSKGFIAASGVNLLKGRDFLDSEFVEFDSVLPQAPSVLLTSEMERRLFHGEGALGKLVYIGNTQYTVVGVIERFVRPSLQNPRDAALSILLPAKPKSGYSAYAIIGVPMSPGLATNEFERMASDRVGNVSFVPFQDLRADSLDSQRYLMTLMVGVFAVSLSIGWLGVYLLTSLWVKHRYPSYAIRRVLGATRTDISRLIAMETQAVCSFGCLLGLALAVFLNRLCAIVYGTSPVSIWILLLTAVAVLSCGLAASIPPALKAARLDIVMTMKRLA